MKPLRRHRLARQRRLATLRQPRTWPRDNDDGARPDRRDRAAGAGKSTVARVLAGGSGQAHRPVAAAAVWMTTLFWSSASGSQGEMKPWSKNPRTVTGHEHRFTDVAATRDKHTQLAEAQIPSRHLITDPPDQAEAVAALIRQRIADGSPAHPNHVMGLGQLRKHPHRRADLWNPIRSRP